MASEEKIFENDLENLAFRLLWPPIKINDLDKWLVEDYSRNISVKVLSKYLQ